MGQPRKSEICAWCGDEVKELFTFTWEETGDRDYICGNCLNGIDFVKEEVKL